MDTTVNTQLGLLVARRDYHKAEAEHYEAQISLEEAKTGIVDNQSQVSDDIMTCQQAYIADCKDEVMRARLVVTKALAKVDHLIMTMQRQRAAANRIISTSIFATGTGLARVVVVTPTQTPQDAAGFVELTKGLDMP